MNRIEKIQNYKVVKDENERIAKENQDREVCELTEEVRALRPRIQRLIETANACTRNDIEIDAYSKDLNRSYDSHERGTFTTNGITHRVGFARTWTYGTKNPVVAEMGIDAGGACGDLDFRTDGENVYSLSEKDYRTKSDPLAKHLKQFLRDFNSFETDFYAYVDNIVESISPRQSEEQTRHKAFESFGENFKCPSDMEKILIYLNAHGTLRVSAQSVEELYVEFSRKRYGSDWIEVTVASLKAFANFLSETDV